MSVSKAWINAKDEGERQQIVDSRRQARMSQIDSLSLPLRQCVHEYGWNVVNAFLLLGLNNPRHIRHLVETVLNEFSPTRGSSSNQGTKRALGIRPDNPLNDTP